jgi:hypothetical protein
MPFIELLKQTRAKAREHNADSWRLPLERLRGRVSGDGIERVTTQTIFDVLEVSQRQRTAGACRRLAKLMREFGWHPIKVRGLTQEGFRDQVRGYARDKRSSAS